METLSEYVADQIGLRMIRLVKTRGASPGVVKRCERYRREMLEEAFDGHVVYTAQDRAESEINNLAKVILKAHAAASENELAAYAKRTPAPLVLLAQLIYFREWRTLREFLEIVSRL